LRIFVCYVGDDTAIVDRLIATLRARDGLALDRSDLDANQQSQDLPEQTKRALDTCDAIVVAYSPAAQDSKSFERELSYAIQLAKLLIPVVIRDVTLLPKDLAMRQPIDVSSDEPTGLQHLLTRVEQLNAGQADAQLATMLAPGRLDAVAIKANGGPLIEDIPDGVVAPPNAPKLPELSPHAETAAEKPAAPPSPVRTAGPMVAPPSAHATPPAPEKPGPVSPIVSPAVVSPAFVVLPFQAPPADLPPGPPAAPPIAPSGAPTPRPRALNRFVITPVALVVVAALIIGILFAANRPNSPLGRALHIGDGRTPLASQSQEINGAPFDQQIVKDSLLASNGAGSDIATLDPALAYDVWSFQAQQLIFPTLVTWDSNLMVIPWVAQRMPTITDGGLVYTFHLRSGVRWTDGEPIDAYTFAYSLNRTLDPCVDNALSGGLAFYLYAIKGATAFNNTPCPVAANSFNPTDPNSLVGSSIQVVDPLTLRITLEKPYAYFLAELMTPAAMAVPKQLITTYGFKQWTNHLIGFGGNMFELTTWDHQGHLNVAQNPSFFQAKTRVKEVDFTIYPNAQAEWNDYLGGRIMIGGPSIADYPNAKGRSDLHISPNLALDYLQPNWARAPFDDVTARQAFALAIDKTALATGPRNGAVIASNHLIPQGNPGYYPNLKGVANAPLTGDPARALQLITQYAQAKCGGVIASCPPVEFWSMNNATWRAITPMLLSQWSAALGGYPITVHTTDFPTLLNAIFGPAASSPQLYTIGYAADYPDPQDWTSLQFSPSYANLGANLGHVNDTQANSILDAADVNQNPTSRFAEYQQAEQILVQDVAWITIEQQQQLLAYTPKLKDYAQTAYGYPTYQTWQTMYLAAG